MIFYRQSSSVYEHLFWALLKSQKKVDTAALDIIVVSIAFYHTSPPAMWLTTHNEFAVLTLIRRNFEKHTDRSNNVYNIYRKTEDDNVDNNRLMARYLS